MVIDILTYPNKTLRQKSCDVLDFDDKLHTLLDNMNDTMMKYGGVGLAAVQIGTLQNVLIINIPVSVNNSDQEDDVQLKENLIEAINPKITKKNGQIVFNEGCLSVPGYNNDIKRASHIEVEYFDRFGKKHCIQADDYFAVAWQHEMEHLSGAVFIDNLSYTNRKKFEKEWKKRK